MKFEILMSCMNQNDDSLVKTSRIVGDVLIVNQCGHEGFAEYKTEQGRALMYSTVERGLTKSRNMAIEHSDADICLLCDDDEVFVEGYENLILDAYNSVPDGDVVIFKMANRKSSLDDKIQELKFPKTMKVSSWQISFKRKSLIDNNIRFDELLGAGTGNGGEEELKFLLDCQKAGLKIYYIPLEIASVAQSQSTWFNGFGKTFFENRGATTRYILGLPMSVAYGIYYLVRKYKMYKENISFFSATASLFKGIKENRIKKQAKSMKSDRKA